MATTGAWLQTHGINTKVRVMVQKSRIAGSYDDEGTS
jgi:hypothetical protein